MEGWIKLYRQIAECSIWENEEPFDMRSAWIDLLLMANHKDKTIVFDGKPLVVKKGQRITSIRTLSDRWHWYPKKTMRFLDLLEELQMITRVSDKRKTLLTIVKYEVFQDSGNSSDNSIYHSSDNSSDTQTRMKRMKKNEKNNKPQTKFNDMIHTDYDFEEIERSILD